MEHSSRFRDREQTLFERDSGLEIRWGSNGRYLVTTKARRKGDVLWSEHPAAALQSLPNREQLDCCTRCFRPIGTFESQMRLALGREDIGPLLAPEDEYVLCPRGQVSCQWGCGVSYCCIECADADMLEGGHSLLCTGPLQSMDHPLVAFKRFAIEHNEIFLLCGQVVAKILLAVARDPRRLGKASSLDALIWPWSLYMRMPWSESVVYTSALSAADRQNPELLEYCSSLPPQQLVEQAVELRRLVVDAFMASDVLKRVPGVAEVAPSVFDHLDARFFEEMVGMCEINCSSINFFGPALTVLRDKKCPEEQRLQAQSFLFRELLEESEEVPDEVTHATALELSEMLPQFDGIALFDRISIMQHSCVPNVVNRFGNDWVAETTATRDIEAGEELVHSYIERIPLYADRSKILKLWGFKHGCQCPACMDERDLSEHESDLESDSSSCD
jgi:hypothetical protein